MEPSCKSCSNSAAVHCTLGTLSCGFPPSIPNGFPGTPNSTTFGGRVTYSCNSGYILSGSATITCQASGSWEAPPRCIGELCDRLLLL